MAKKVIALAGGIGSGKSTAGRFFKNRGFCVIDCDEISAEVATDGKVLDQIASVFGSRFVIDGKLDRRALSVEVFADKKKTEKLNSVFHPEILKRLRQRIDSADGTVFVEIPLLEQYLSSWFDQVWLFTAQKQTVVDRVAKRDGRKEEEVSAILDRQNKYGCVEGVTRVANDATLQDFEEKLALLAKNIE